MQIHQHMESQVIFDPKFNQWHRHRSFDCSKKSPLILRKRIISHFYIKLKEWAHNIPSFQEPHWQSQEQFISYRGSQDDSYSPFVFSWYNAMVHGPFKKKEMTSTGVSALAEMVCLENLPCGTLQFTLFQVPPVAVQKREFCGRQLGKGVLHQFPVKRVHSQSIKLSL